MYVKRLTSGGYAAGTVTAHRTKRAALAQDAAMAAHRMAPGATAGPVPWVKRTE